MTEDMRQPPTEDLILRDHLAIYRTVMANERTLLAYTRTALAMVVVGVTVANFSEWSASSFLGWSMTMGGALLQLIGLRRYAVTRDRIRKSK